MASLSAGDFSNENGARALKGLAGLETSAENNMISVWQNTRH